MARAVINVFERVEVKYLLPKEKYEAFLQEIKPYLALDEYGLTTIMNIYYDTADNDLVSRSLMRPKYKEKLRLRTYGLPTADSPSFVEIKKKVTGVVYKRREMLPLAEAVAFLDEGAKPSKDSQIVKELTYFRDFYHPVPKMVLCYDREAFYGLQDPEFRMTIDRNVRYRTTDLDLTHGDAGELVDPEGNYLLEIKAGDAMPLFMVHILTKLKIYPISFSKYGTAYSILNGDTEELPSFDRRPSVAAAAAVRERTPTWSQFPQRALARGVAN